MPHSVRAIQLSSEGLTSVQLAASVPAVRLESSLSPLLRAALCRCALVSFSAAPSQGGQSVLIMYSCLSTKGEICPRPSPDSFAWWQHMLPAPRRDNLELQRVRRIVFGLNALHVARPNHALAPHAAARLRPSVAQRTLLSRLVHRVRFYEAPPSEFEPEVCLSQILASKDLYSQEPR